MKKIIIIPVIILLLSSCQKGHELDCLKSTGEMTSEDRTLDSFSEIHVYDNIHLILTSGKGNTITVEAGKNTLHGITSEIREGKLHIKNNNTCNWVRSYSRDIKVYADIQTPEVLTNHGYGSVTCEKRLDKDQLIVHQYGQGDIHLDLNISHIWMDLDRLGDIYLKGNIHQVSGWIYNIGNIYAQEADCHTFYLVHQGLGNSYVRAQNALGVIIENKGNVFYKGDPEIVDLKRTGLGQLFKID